MEVMNVNEASAKLSDLIKRALEGEEIILSEEGKPLVKLTPLKPNLVKKRKPGGSWKGKIKIADNFDDENEDINKMFEGNYS